jgi:hypothetical protein
LFRLVVLLIITLCLSSCGIQLAQQATIDIALDRAKGSSAAVSTFDGRVVIDVVDPWGINGLHATLASGEWPAEVIVRLPHGGLERLEIRYGDYTIATGVSSNESPDPPLILYVTDERGNVSQAPVSSAIYIPNIRRTDGGFEVSLPPHFFRDEYAAFSLYWIDFYRQ